MARPRKENKEKLELKSILVDKKIYETFKRISKANGFKVKDLTEKLMLIYCNENKDSQ